ncbi:MAG: FliH/SctL family protein [Aureliella sp.]
MSVFRLDLNRSLPEVSSDEARIIIQETTTPDTTYQEEALQTLQGLAGKLDSHYAGVVTQIAEMRNSYASGVIELTRVLVGADTELVERRLQRFLDTAFEAIQPAKCIRIVVHPDQRAMITEWLEASGRQEFELQVDVSLLPGDCRVDSESSGFSATLDAFLDRARELIDAQEVA